MRDVCIGIIVALDEKRSKQHDSIRSHRLLYLLFCSLHYLLLKHALLLQTCPVRAFLGGSLCV